MLKILPAFVFSLVLTFAAFSAEPPVAVPPLKALLVTGGGFHDFTNQKRIVSEGISARANVTWTVVQEGTTREHMMSIYTNANWAQGFDVIVHNECFGFVTNNVFIETITAAHKAGLPGVVLHCSTHSYRNATTDEWRKLLGVTSRQHGAQHEFQIVNLKPEHPVMKGFPEKWQNSPDELYQVIQAWPDLIPLGKAVSPREAEQVCIWVNTYGQVRIFGTTLGHSNATMESPVYLDLVTRGLLWACDKIEADGKPKPGYAAKR